MNENNTQKENKAESNILYVHKNIVADSTTLKKI